MSRIVGGAEFGILVMFNEGLEVLEETLPSTIEALTAGSRCSCEVILVADGSSASTVAALAGRAAHWGVDEVRWRLRRHHVAEGAPANNAHIHHVSDKWRYLVTLQYDVLLIRTDERFDPLLAAKEVFAAHPEIGVITTMTDHDEWSWRLKDIAPPAAPGLRIVNRVADHFLIYDTERFIPLAEDARAFHLGSYADTDEVELNWEDMVSYIGTSGRLQIGWPTEWPMVSYHCDVKIVPGAPLSTQDDRVKLAVSKALKERHSGGGREAG